VILSVDVHTGLRFVGLVGSGGWLADFGWEGFKSFLSVNAQTEFPCLAGGAAPVHGALSAPVGSPELLLSGFTKPGQAVWAASYHLFVDPLPPAWDQSLRQVKPHRFWMEILWPISIHSWTLPGSGTWQEATER
jgi:hypothetical protein